MAAGFRLSEYIAPSGTFDLRGVFLQRKGNPHDIVFFNGTGPRLHHFAFLAPEVHHLLHACDVAGELGFGTRVERGPGRHGPGHAMYVYMRDPDGHRVELFNTHYQIMDIENEPIGWDPSTLPSPTLGIAGAPGLVRGSNAIRGRRHPRAAGQAEPDDAREISCKAECLEVSPMLDNPEIAKETLASHVYDRLRQDIISVAIEPGEKLHIRSLCERFDVGLSPMREALSRLSSEGLVAQSDHRGFAVAPMGEEDLVDITRALLA
ncbi:GntR family transcriptional regulator [Bradyrhizobium sp. RDT10]